MSRRDDKGIGLWFDVVLLIVAFLAGIGFGLSLTAPALERCEQALDTCGDHYDECVLEGEIE